MFDRFGTALNFGLMCLITLMMYHLKLTLTYINKPYNEITKTGIKLEQIERREYCASVCTLVLSILFSLLIVFFDIFDYLVNTRYSTEVLLEMPMFLLLLLVYTLITHSLLKQIRLI